MEIIVLISRCPAKQWNFVYVLFTQQRKPYLVHEHADVIARCWNLKNMSSITCEYSVWNWKQNHMYVFNNTSHFKVGNVSIKKHSVVYREVGPKKIVGG